MTTVPLPSLSLGISPSSAAQSASGLDMFGGLGGSATGNISVGSGSDSWVSGLVRDFAIGVAVAMAAKWAWGRIK